jgi:hypothetical protein
MSKAKRTWGLSPLPTLLLIWGLAGGAAASDDYDVLQRADQARGNLQGVAWVVALTSGEGQRRQSMGFDVKARGFDVLAVATSPARSRGDKLLMLRENVWFHKPGLSKPVPISKRQRLLGQAAYGDIPATDYANDYDAVRLPDEAVDGEPCHVFELTSRHRWTTYDRIRYWVSKERLVGVQGEYYTVSGKRFKTSRMFYDNRIDLDGEPRPFISRMEIRGVLADQDYTLLEFSEPRLEPVPEHTFNLSLFTSR